MKFDIDQQTRHDLEIDEGASSGISFFKIFDRANTFGAKLKLRSIFNNPLVDRVLIENRQKLIRFLQSTPAVQFIDKNEADFIEHYLSCNITINFSKFKAIEQLAIIRLTNAGEYYTLEKGIGYSLNMLNNFFAFISACDINNGDCPEYIKKCKTEVTDIFEYGDFKNTLATGSKESLSFREIAFFDKLLRGDRKREFRILLDYVYEFDCFMAIAKVSSELNFAFPVVKEIEGQYVSIKGLFHPFLTDPVANDVMLDREKNIMFLTGANMAGKSTFLKSFASAVFLTHLGFPVPATGMETSIFNGIMTTINLSDNLQLGYSHFYSEVLRVKEVAIKIKTVGNLLIIFDELFRGTNVVDASEGSFAIINAFSKRSDSLFIVSTHIAEVADKLENNEKIKFSCFATSIVGNKPAFSYKLLNGISQERLGMVIINQENILEIIESDL